MLERASHSAPCIFCGNVGWDMRVHYNESGEDEVVHYCHKTEINGLVVSKGDIVNIETKSYICITTGKDLGQAGLFNLWKEYLSKEEWIEKQKRINPDFGKNSGSSRSNSSNRNLGKLNTISKQGYSNKILEGEVPPRSPKERHEFNTYLASLLVLEDKHKEALLSEWNNNAYPDIFSDITTKWLIRSFPPQDKARYANGERFKCPTRKKLIEKLVKRFGDLRGYPMMYLRTGAYWDNKPERERWDFSCSEGILFPCYDKDGYLDYRIKPEYPDHVLREDKGHPKFKGKYGRFHHFYNKDGKHCWSFRGEKEEKDILVYGPSSDYSLPLNKKGLPPHGKVEGKYTAISSVKGKLIEVPNGFKAVNQFYQGCKIGSSYSLYYHDTDSFSVVIGTEGEKKAMVANTIRKTPTVSVPGVSAYEILFVPDENGVSLIDYLKKRGMKIFILCYDADKNTNETVLMAEKKFLETLRKHDVTPYIGEWKGKFNKGIDDILLMGLDIVVRRA